MSHCLGDCLSSHKLLRSPRKPARKISKIPFKVLDAPELQDDFYLNLVDWSAGNLLSVGLGACVYLWSACTSQVGIERTVVSFEVRHRLWIVDSVCGCLIYGVLCFNR